MTACRNKARGAVVAALAGALTLGAAPVMALAVDGGASLMASEASDVFSRGEITFSDNKDSFEYTGAKQVPGVEKVTPQGATGDAVVDEDELQTDDYKIYYVRADAEGEPTDELVPEPIDPGTYCVVVEDVSGDYAGGKVWRSFTITGQTFGTVDFYVGDDTSNTTPSYTGEPVELTFTSGGVKLVEGVDYAVEYFDQGVDWRNGNGSETAPTDSNAANGGRGYYAHLTGVGKYAGQTADVNFSIGQYSFNVDDFVVPVVVADDNDAMPTGPLTVKGSEELAKHFTFSYGANQPGDKNRLYTPDVKLADPEDKNVDKDSLDSARVDVYKAKHGLTFTYGGEAIPETMTLNASKNEKFDVAKLAASYVGDDDEEKAVTVAAGNVTVTDSAGNDVNLSDLAGKKGGTFTVTVSLVDGTNTTGDDECLYGGTVQFTLEITSGSLDLDEALVVYYDGKAVSSIETTYSGSPVSYTWKVFDGKKNVTDQFSAEVKDSEGNVVTSVVDAGDYTVTLKSDDYALENNTFDINVGKLHVTQVRIHAYEDGDTLEGGMLVAMNGRLGLKYTGSAISPVVEYATGERDADGTLKWFEYGEDETAADAYLNLTYTKDGEAVKQIIDKGGYTLSVAASAAVKAANLEVTADSYDFTVGESTVFVDVPTDAYYHDAVVKANENLWVFGLNNSDVFAPNNSISRADVVVILYRMAGGSVQSEDWEAGPEAGAYLSQYSDVTGKEYYAEALAWATKAGVVTGYEDGTFGGADMVTTEQFVTMLGRYAKLVGGYEAPADVDAALGEKADGDRVSQFAEEYVAWALEEGYLGRDGADIQPQVNVSRGRAVTIAVRYQPERLSSPVANPMA